MPDSSRDLAGLRQVLDDLLALPGGLSAPTLPRSAAPAFALAWGWYMRVHRTARAVALHIDHELEEETAPLLRSMIEHVVALQRLTDAPEATIASLRRQQQGRIKKMQAKLADADWPIPIDVFDALLTPEAPSTDQDHLIAFAHVCQHYDAKHFYIAWLAETVRSHPTILSAMSYTGGSSLDDLALYDAPPDRDRDVPAQVALLLHAASEHLNAMLPGTPWTAPLDELAKRYRIALNLVPPTSTEPPS